MLIHYLLKEDAFLSMEMSNEISSSKTRQGMEEKPEHVSSQMLEFAIRH
jgi:hypothetical protein